MFSITLYGHLVIDTIYDTNCTMMEFGGMANMRRTFCQLDPKLDVGLVPTVIGTADIFINRAESERTSKANLNVTQLPIAIKQSKISHILYINELPNTDFVSQLPGIVTADCCKGKLIDLNLLKYVDYLFVSDDEVRDLDGILNAIKGTVIIHSPTGSVSYKNKKEQTYSIDPALMVKNANVLGAGDMFAAAFLLALNNNMTNAIEYAHITTSTLLKKTNEKI